MEEMTLASELLHELKKTTKRWFIAFLVMVGLEVATIGTFIWYITLPVEEYDIQQESTGRSLNIINDGGTVNGGEATDYVQEESGQN